MSNDDSQTTELSQDDLSRPVDDLEVPVHTHKALKSVGIHSIGDLLKRSEAEIMGNGNLTRRLAYELFQVLSKEGYSLREEEQPNRKVLQERGSSKTTKTINKWLVRLAIGLAIYFVVGGFIVFVLKRPYLF